MSALHFTATPEGNPDVFVLLAQGLRQSTESGQKIDKIVSDQVTIDLMQLQATRDKNILFTSCMEKGGASFRGIPVIVMEQA